VASDQIRIQGNQLTVLNHAIAALLVPGIGARTGIQHACFDPLAAERDVLLMEQRPQSLLADAGLEGFAHDSDAGFAGADRVAHGAELLFCLDAPRLLGDGLAFDDLDTAGTQGEVAHPVEAIHGEPAIASAGQMNQIGDLVRPGTRDGLRFGSGHQIYPGPPRAHFVDEIHARAQMRAAWKLEEDYRTLGRDEGIARRIVQAPHLHVCHIGRVADIDGIQEHGARAVRGDQRGAQPREPLRAQLREIDGNFIPDRERRSGHTY
jgi:hypothetical protein